MAERSFKREIEDLRLGRGDVFTGEGILAITKALLESGVGYVGGYQGAPISHLMDVLADAEDLLADLGVRYEANASEAAAAAIHDHEQQLTNALLFGTGNLAGLADLAGVTILGGTDNPDREGLVSFTLDALPAADIVAQLNAQGIRTHVRKADHYSGNILTPLGLDAAVRVSLCHYNSMDEVRALLTAMKDIAA